MEKQIKACHEYVPQMGIEHGYLGFVLNVQHDHPAVTCTERKITASLLNVHVETISSNFVYKCDSGCILFRGLCFAL